jgi:HPt (histidine-containing phosphotransfer) domain-containing protein
VIEKEYEEVGMSQEELFDLDAVLADYMDGDKSLFDELAKVFVEELRCQLKDIYTGIETGDSKLVERAAHSIKGSASTFVAKRACEAAQHLEALGQEGSIAEFPPAAAILEHELELLCAALTKALDEDVPLSTNK